MRISFRAWSAAGILGLVAGCGASGMRIEPRYVAVHNAMSAVGLHQVGPISEASLDRGGELRIPLGASGECRTFVAIGEKSLRDLDVSVRDAAGNVLAHDESTSHTSAVEYCGGGGDAVLHVRALSGHGEVIVSSYAGGGGRGGSRGGGAASGCASPRTIVPGQPISGDTSSGTNTGQGSCLRGAAPDVTYRLVLDQPALVTIEVEASFDAGVYVLRTCGQPSSEVACNDDAGDTTHSRISTTLEAGTYYIVVDGYGDGAGAFDLRVNAAPLVPIAQLCSEAPALTPGVEVSGNTTSDADRFQATCAGGARSPDTVHKLVVAERSRVRIHQRTEYDGALYVRRACEDAASEIACNDDWTGTTDSLVTSVLDPGTYYVFTDGFGSAGQSVSGSYSLVAEVAPPAGGGAPGDACAAPAELTVGSTAEVDTFRAADDFQGSCGGHGAADVVYRVHVPTRARLDVSVKRAQFSGVAYLRRACADGSPELACQAFDMATNRNAEGKLSADVEPGDYFLVIDGTDAASFGAASVDVRLVDLQAMARTCERAPMLHPGRTVNGNTSTSSDQFQASCAGNAESNDSVYRIRLTRRQHVSLELATPEHDGAIHLRRECTSSESEIACNDDDGDNRHSRIETNLDPGTYYVIVDGFSTGNAGPYSLRFTTSEPRANPPREAREPRGEPAPDGGREYKR